MRLIWAFPALVIAGCAAPEPRPDPIPFALDNGGIQLLDRPQRVDFGRTYHSTISAMEKLVARPVQAQGACLNGGTYVLFGDDTRLHVANGNFVGWSRGETGGTIQQAGRACVRA